MEKHFLDHIVKGVSRQPPEPWYSPEGDCIIYQMADEAIVADRVDAVLTIYRSATTNKVIGYQMKAVAALARKFGWDGVLVESRQDEEELKEVSLSALLLAAYEQGPKTIGRRKSYADAIETCAPHSRIRIDDLQPMVAA